MRRGIWISALLSATACLFSATGASAQQQGFADDGRIVLGAERLTGLYFERMNLSQTEGDVETEIDANTTTFAILGNSMGLAGGDTTAGGTSMSPRLGVDFFIASGFSVGGAITYVHAAGTTQGTVTIDGDEEEGDEEDQATVNGLVFAPRVGFAIPLNPTIAIWPRAGITYSRYWSSEEVDTIDEMGNDVTVDQTATLSYTDLTIEGMLAVTPTPNFAIVFGPFLDLGLGGSLKSETDPDVGANPEDIDFNYTAFGITGGIAVVF
jgi:hypothetical protein